MLRNLTTEAQNPASRDIDALSALQIVELMNAEDAKVAQAVALQAEPIAKTIELVADRLRRGGRLLYIGAGTSGRLGVLDAAECPPTFNTEPSMVVGVIAGGRDALVRAVEGAEDVPERGASDLAQHQVSDRDLVVGIATSGRTPYVQGALEHARKVGAATVGLVCNADAVIASACDIVIAPIVGPEVIGGSTRLKAGTATKMVLNMITTGAMVRIGKTFGNFMVDLRATNEKLRDRSRRIVAALAEVDEPAAQKLLDQCAGEVKTAIVAQRRKVDAHAARGLLDRAQGHLRRAMDLPLTEK